MLHFCLVPLKGYIHFLSMLSILERTIARCNLALPLNGKVNDLLLFSFHQFEGILCLLSIAFFISSVAF